MNNSRPLYIFTPARNDTRLADQVRIIQNHQAEADDREIVLIIEINGDRAASGPNAADLSAEDSDQAAARHRFKIGPADFAVILVGKDGGEKLRSTKPVSFDKLRETIDSMPMRQREVRK